MIGLDQLADEVQRLTAGGQGCVRVRRQGVGADSCSILLDVFSPGLACATITASERAMWSVPAGSSLTLSPDKGLLLSDSEGDSPQYWFPMPPRQARLDGRGRLLELGSTGQFDFTVNGGIEGRLVTNGKLVEAVIWILPRGLAHDTRTNLERVAWYLLGSHTKIQDRGDLYLHMVSGVVFENRLAYPNNWRVFSENDAHALHLVLGGLAKASRDPVLTAMRDQVLLAVLGRQSPDGGYRHGEWTDLLESHFRLHCSAMHLMMDVLSEGEDEAVLQALTSAAAFLARQSVDLRIGKWLLHDELEHSIEHMRLGPFKWVPSNAFGKTESNMLVLNSHLDALVALDRYRALTGDTQYEALVRSGREAACALLAARAAEPLYRAVMWLVEMTFLPASKAMALPLWKRALKRLTWKYLIPRLPDLKARFPRLVMPGGYIDRELTLRTWAHDYHAINLMDLARYLRRFDDAVVRQVLLEGLAFTRRSGILERWRELDYQKYALGFWAEALYHVCTLFPDAHYRQWLAEVMLVLEDQSMGLPPSLLGANAEAVPPAEQLPCPSPADARLRVANLGRRGAPELLVVNASDSPLDLAWEAAPAEPVVWHTAAGKVALAPSIQVPARGWLWGRAAH